MPHEQRLGLALALLGGPRLVVLDEPTNGLDPAGIVEVRKLIKELPARGTTVLVSSHQLAEVELMCDRATIIHRGRLLAEGTIAELLARHGGAGFATQVAPDEAGRAAEILRRAGLTATTHDDGRVAVPGAIDDGAQIRRPLADEGIHVRELWREGARLEGVFLALTEDGDEEEAGAASAEVTTCGQRTIRRALTADPRRLRLVGAKLAVVLAAVTALSVVIGLAAAPLLSAVGSAHDDVHSGSATRSGRASPTWSTI